MKRLTPLFTLLVFFACGGKDENTSKNPDFDISYSIDTVHVDAGDHFFFVQFGLSLSDVDKSRKLLYNFNNDSFSMEIIDLENLQLKEVIQFEKEGPNGIGGGYIFRIQVLPDESILFYDFIGIHHIANSGKKIATHKLDEIKWQGNALAENEEINTSSLTTKDGKTFYGFYGTGGFDSKTNGLVQLNLEDLNLRMYPSGFLDFTSAFDVSFIMDGRGIAKFPERNLIRAVAEKILISTTAKNELWEWNLTQDSLLSHPYHSSLTSDIKKGNFPVTASSNQEWTEALKEKYKEVDFGNLIDDPDRSTIWRYSSEMERLTAGDSIINRAVLTAFDSKLNQLGEVRLPEYFKKPDKPFLLNGMLWQFLNIEDEVAFVRIKPTIK